MRKWLVVILAAMSAWQCSPVLMDKSVPVTAQDLHNHVSYLASDELAGRKPGSTGGRLAADYIRQQLNSYGLDLIGKDGYQYFTVVTDINIGTENSLELNGFSGTVSEDFTPLSFSENTNLSAPVVFVGYGFHFDDDSVSRNDYRDLDMTNKWVLIMRGDPEPDNPDSPYLPFSTLRSKVVTARDHNAAGVIFASGVKFDSRDDLIDLYYEGGQKSVGIPVVHIKRPLADQLLAPAGTSVEQLENRLIDGELMAPIELATEFTATTEVVKTEQQTQNVLAVLPGSDPVLRDEYLVVGAHYDHLGFGGPGSGSRRPDTTAIHNGADDNASGTAALLELARSLSQSSTKLKRSVLFIAFGAEEMGLLGSKYFTANPLVDLDNVAAMFNLDMLGGYVPDSSALSIGGTGTAIGLSDLVTEQADRAGIPVKLSPEGYGPSDHAAFYSKDIPVLFFFTGAHKRYHTPDDDANLLNYTGEQQIVRFIRGLAVDFANRGDDLVFQEAGPKTRTNVRSRFKVTLGIMPDHAADVTGLRIDVTIPGRPADLAGLKNGDVIISMDGRPVGDIYDYMHRLSEFRVGQRISVEVLRDEEELILIVDL